MSRQAWKSQAAEGSHSTVHFYTEFDVLLAEWQRCQPSKLDRRVRFPQGTLIRVGSSAAERVPVKHKCAGSSPVRPFLIASSF